MNENPVQPVTLSIIIHEDFSHIRRALHSIIDHTGCVLKIYLTINAGKTEETEQMRQEFPQVELMVNESPRGFAENHNRILRLADTKYVVIMNDDIEVAPRMIDRLVEYMDQHPEVALVSPRVLNPDGTPQLMAFSDPSLIRMLYKVTGLGFLTRQGSPIRTWVMRSPLRRWLRTASLQTYTDTQFVPVVVGVVMCARRTAFQQAGMMDEDTRVYGEEYGWHWRLRRHGWSIALFTETFVTHFNVEQPIQGWKLSEHRKGMLNYFIRYRPRWQTFVLRATMIVIHTIRAVFSLFVSRQQAAAELKTVITALTFQPKQ